MVNEQNFLHSFFQLLLPRRRRMQKSTSAYAFMRVCVNAEPFHFYLFTFVVHSLKHIRDTFCAVRTYIKIQLFWFIFSLCNCQSQRAASKQEKSTQDCIRRIVVRVIFISSSFPFQLWFEWVCVCWLEQADTFRVHLIQTNIQMIPLPRPRFFLLLFSNA